MFIKKTLFLSALIGAASLTGVVHGAVDVDEETPLVFSSALISEVINQVQVIETKSLKFFPAKINDVFQAPNMLRTGRKSRAQLSLIDGTVVRVGSNAVFSFEAQSRTIRLKSGSVLFHSPTGKGGGTIITNSATASVIGTTILVTATNNGGFKMSVLEGIGQVNFVNGTSTKLHPGQMTFVLPPENAEGSELSSEGESDAGGTGGVQGPVLNFDLATMVRESGLLNGFSSALASSGKIQAAVAVQAGQLQEGDLVATGLQILGASSAENFAVADAASVRQQSISADMNLAIAQNDEMRLAADLLADLVLDGTTPVPERFVFRNPVDLPNMPVGTDFTGIVAGTVTFGNGSIDLSGVIDSPQAAIVGNELIFNGNVSLVGLGEADHVMLVGTEVRSAPGAQVEFSFGGQAGAATIISEVTWNLDGFSASNLDGNMSLAVTGGDLLIADSSVTAGGSAGAVGLISQTGAVEILNSAVGAVGGVTIEAGTSILIDGSTLASVAGEATFSGDTITIVNGSLIEADTITFQKLPRGLITDFTVTDSTLDAQNGLQANASGNVTIAGSQLSAGTGTMTLGGNVVTISAGSTLNAQEIAVHGTNGLSLINSTATAVGDSSWTASGGIFDLTNATLTSITGNVTLTVPASLQWENSAIFATSGRVDISVINDASLNNGRIAAGAGISLTGTHITATNLELTGANSSVNLSATDSLELTNTLITAGNISLNGTNVTISGGSLLAQGNSLTITARDTVQLTGTALTMPGALPASVTISAGTIVLADMTLPSGMLMTLFSQNGTLSLAGIEAGAVNFRNITHADDLIYSPAQNIGNIGNPIHILPTGAVDLRMTQLEYAMSHPLEYVTVSTGMEEVSNNFIFRKVVELPVLLQGLPGAVATNDPDMLKLVGALAANLPISAKLISTVMNANLDFTALQVPTVKFYGMSASVVGQLDFSVANAIQRVEFGSGTTLDVSAGNSIKASFTNGNYAENVFMLRAVGNVTLAAVTVESFHGNLEIHSGADASLNETTVIAGCGAATHTGGNITIAAAATLQTSNAHITGKQDLSQITLGAPTVRLNGTNVSAGTQTTGSYIRIQGAALVSIQGGQLVASHVNIGGITAGQVSVPLTQLEIDGTTFNTPALAMDARTIVVRNVDFASGTNVTMTTDHGGLNIMDTQGAMFGAVNFQGNTVKYNGTSLTDSAGINSLVYVDGHTATNPKIYFDQTTQPFSTVPGADATAPIKIYSR